MRGVAVLAAMGAGWVIGSRMLIPKLRIAVPHVALRTVAASAAVALVTFVLAVGVIGLFVPSAALAAIGAAVPIARDRGRRRREEAALRDRWPDVLMHIRSSITAGSTLADATVDACSAAGGRFADLADQVRNEVAFGGGFVSAMERIRLAAQDPTSDRVLVTLANASSTGGTRVGDIVAALARSVGDEARLRQAHDAAMTEQRLTITVCLMAPWVILALSIATNPQAQAAFGTSEGAVVIGIGFSATVAGWLLAARTARLREPRSVFR